MSATSPHTEPVHLLADLRELKLPAFAEHFSRVADEACEGETSICGGAGSPSRPGA